MSNENAPTTQTDTEKPSPNKNQMTNRRISMLDLDKITNEELIESSIVIMKKLAHTRTTKDISILEKCTQDVVFFKSIIADNGHDTYIQCLKYSQYAEFQKYQQIFQIGSIGQHFYVIIKGSVGIWVPKDKNLIPGSYSGNYVSPPIEDMVEVKILSAGASFGDLALIDNKPRAATIISREQTILATLDKFSYKQILRKREEEDNGGDGVFVVNKDILALELQLIEEVFVQDEVAERAFIIKSGEFKIIKYVYSECNQVEDDEDNEAKQSLSKGSRWHKLPKRVLEITLLSAGEIVGEEHLLTDEPRTYSLICVSQVGEALEINKRNFYNFLMKDEKTCIQIRVRQKQRGEYIESRVSQQLRIGLGKNFEHIIRQYMKQKLQSYQDSKIQKRIKKQNERDEKIQVNQQISQQQYQQRIQQQQQQSLKERKEIAPLRNKEEIQNKFRSMIQVTSRIKEKQRRQIEDEEITRIRRARPNSMEIKEQQQSSSVSENNKKKCIQRTFSQNFGSFVNFVNFQKNQKNLGNGNFIGFSKKFSIQRCLTASSNSQEQQQQQQQQPRLLINYKQQCITTTLNSDETPSEFDKQKLFFQKNSQNSQNTKNFIKSKRNFPIKISMYIPKHQLKNSLKYEVSSIFSKKDIMQHSFQQLFLKEDSLVTPNLKALYILNKK